MAYWLVKSEPNAWSWDDHVKAGTAEWDGVRNHQAKSNLQAMGKGDQAFFYHSGKERSIVGIVKVVRTYYPDPTDPTGRFGMVDFQVMGPMKVAVSLSEVRNDPRLEDLTLLRNSRLSVQPVDPKSWKIMCKMGRVKP